MQLLSHRAMTLLLASCLLAFSAGEQARAAKQWVYIGTYTGGGSEGIYLCELDLESGKLRQVGLAGKAANPSFVAIHPNQKFLYAVSEVGNFDGKPAGGVTAFAIDRKTGQLEKLNAEPCGGKGPCHIVVDASGKNVLVANYGGGSVAVLPIQPDGRLKPVSSFIQHEGSSVTKRQKSPHAHSINVGPNNKYAFAADLGLDKVLIYRFDARAGTLTPNELAFAKVEPGSGPRHFAFHPRGKTAYVINELTSTVTAFAFDASSGKLEPVQTLSTLPQGYSGGNSTAEVQAHPSGKFLYGSNRGHNSLAIFRIDDAGKLTAVGHQSTGGKTPRNFGIDPTGAFVLAANQGTGNVVVLAVDSSTGKLKPTGSEVKIPRPVCVKFLPQAD